MGKEEKDNYTKLLDIEPKWLIDYLADMIAENEDDLSQAIDMKDREWVEGIIENHIY